MAYSAELVSKLTGASFSQLDRIRRRGILVPEVGIGHEVLYSFRDVLAVRSIMWLRADFSMQAIRKIVDQLDRVPLDAEHLAEVKFAKAGRTVLVSSDDGFTDVLREPGSRELRIMSLGDLFGPFKTYRDRPVPDLRRPSAHLTIDELRMGGLPVIEGTRIPYSTIAELVDGDSVLAEDIPQFYPRVTPEQAKDAVAFAASLPKRGRAG